MTLQEKLDNLPAKPGCYLFKDKQGQVLYVGKALILRNRVRSYFQKSRPFHPRTALLVKRIADVEVFVVDNEIEALILENTLIKDRKPRFNVNLKDDKSYPSIRVTNEDFPQVFVTRKIVRDGSSYFGPYTDVKNLRFTLKTLQRLFPIRTCKYNLNEETIRRKSVSLCLEYYIKKCKGPCQGLHSREEYDAVIRQVKSFLRGKTDDILKSLKREMEEQSARLEFEEAARTRDKLQALQTYRNTQKVVQNDGRDRDIIALAREDNDACAVLMKIRDGKVLGRVHKYIGDAEWYGTDDLIANFVRNYYLETEDLPQDILTETPVAEHETLERLLSGKSGRRVHFTTPQIGEKKKLVDMARKNARFLLEELKLQKIKAGERVPHAVKALKRDLRLEREPRRIECFDISNIQGTDPVAAMVCFVDGKPRKSEYRVFHIRVKETPDDFAMLREAVQRRYSRLLKENKSLPDLIVIDGGKGQLSGVVRVLRELGLEKQPVIGLAKRLEEVFFPGVSDAQMLPRTSSSLKLIQQLRDEAHRFGVMHHRKRRKKRTLVSEIDRIEGIGPRRHSQLLKRFGSVKKIREADVEQLIRVGGLPQKIALNVYNHFHGAGE